MGNEFPALQAAELPRQQRAQGTPGTPAVGDTERELCDIFAGVAGLDEVSADQHFFDQLNADSMMMAQFCARVRKHPGLPSVSIKDIYRHPTVRELAAALLAAAPPEADDTPAETPVPTGPVEMPVTATTRQYVGCGALQLLCFLAYVYLAAVAYLYGYEWISAGSGVVELYLRAVGVGGLIFTAICVLPIAAKWLLVGRWTPRRFPVWSLAYFRFWLVKVLIRANPLVLLVGSPVYVLYLRALGAKIGPGVAIFSLDVPACPDLLTVGAGTVIRKDAHFTCYRARAGMIETGTVVIGRNALVSEATVLDIHTSLGDDAQLGHASSLHSTQAVPDAQRWHGSPAQPTDVDFRSVEPVPCSVSRRFFFGLGQLGGVLFLYVPLSLGGVAILVDEAPGVVDFLAGWSADTYAFVRVLVASLMVYLGLVLLAAAGVFVLPRVLAAMIVPDKAYPLYGFHFSLHRTITRLTNLRFLNELFGNSSYVVPYVHRLGYDVSRAEQTGSNLGTEFKHETPYLVSIGRGTMIADGLSLVNAEYSSSSFMVAKVTIGAHNFLGNRIAYPSRGNTGENCLLATKVMVPIDGPLRENTGLLGSPSFEIPRSVERDSHFDHLKTDGNLEAKNRHNRRTIAFFLLSRWLEFLGLTAIFVLTDRYQGLGSIGVAVDILLALLFSFVYFALLERAAGGFRALTPRFCSIYDPYFWWHERFWKFEMSPRLVRLVGGTPFKNVLSRLLGAQVGRRVFDDDCSMPERSLVSIGDDCTLNAGSVIQCHSQEDGSFKSDRIRLGNGCTLGTGSLIHYGSTMGDGAVLGPDAFLMKGAEAIAGTFWTGNPAREIEPDRARVAPSVEGRTRAGAAQPAIVSSR